MLTEETKSDLLNAGIYAPSADNSQPVEFEWYKDNILDVWIDQTRSGKSSDNRFVLSDIAIGAVIENIVIKGNSLLLKSEIGFFPNGEEAPYFVARITFTKTAEELDKTLADAIPRRCTDRRFPFKGPVSPASVDKLSEAASSYGCSVTWYLDKQAIKATLPVIQKAESVRFKSEQLHQELFSTVKFGAPDADEGMPIEVLAIEKPAQPFFKLMKKWSVMKVFNWFGAYAMLGIRSVRLPILFSPALALIKIPNNDRISVINGGRALQRLWLTAAEEELAIQPYAAPGIFSLGFVDHEDHFKNEFQQVKNLMSSLVNEEYGLIFLRIGKSSTVKHRTNRRDRSTFVRKT